MKVSWLWGGGASGIFLCEDSEKWELFLELLNDRQGFVVSRHPPSRVREKLGVREVPILWLTKIECKECVYPTRISYLLQTLVDFMRKDDAPKVVLLDGSEYLVLENGFKPVFKSLTTLKDYALLNNTIVILPISEGALDSKEYALLTEEFLQVRSTG